MSCTLSDLDNTHTEFLKDLAKTVGGFIYKIDGQNDRQADAEGKTICGGRHNNFMLKSFAKPDL